MKLKRLRLIAGITIVLLTGVILAGWLLKVGVSPKPVAKPTASAPKANENVLLGMTIKIPGNEGNSHWELKVTRFSSLEHIGRMQSIRGDYYLDGQPIYHISARAGEINWETRKLRFNDQVEFTSNDGKKLSAQEFLWDPVQNRIFAADQVVLSSPGLVVTTRQLEADPRLDRIIFKGATKFIYEQVKTAKLAAKTHPRGER
ncbi:MAG TPA: LPS export ABC transporter periplasmic protein LptC [Bacillota bacterium]